MQLGLLIRPKHGGRCLVLFFDILTDILIFNKLLNAIDVLKFLKLSSFLLYGLVDHVGDQAHRLLSHSCWCVYDYVDITILQTVNLLLNVRQILLIIQTIFIDTLASAESRHTLIVIFLKLIRMPFFVFLSQQLQVLESVLFCSFVVHHFD